MDIETPKNILKAGKKIEKIFAGNFFLANDAYIKVAFRMCFSADLRAESNNKNNPEPAG